MKKVLKWFAVTVGAVWLVWALVGEAPGELKPSTTSQVLQALQGVTPTPTKVALAPTPTVQPLKPPPIQLPTATPTRPLLPTPMKASANDALCQDALARRLTFLKGYDPLVQATMGSMSSDDARQLVRQLSASTDQRDLQVRIDYSALANLTGDVERYCGQ